MLAGPGTVALMRRPFSGSYQVAARAIVIEKKTQRPVQFEITWQTRDAVSAWFKVTHLDADEYSLV